MWSNLSYSASPRPRLIRCQLPERTVHSSVRWTNRSENLNISKNAPNVLVVPACSLIPVLLLNYVPGFPDSSLQLFAVKIHVFFLNTLEKSSSML